MTFLKKYFKSQNDNSNNNVDDSKQLKTKAHKNKRIKNQQQKSLLSISFLMATPSQVMLVTSSSTEEKKNTTKRNNSKLYAKQSWRLQQEQHATETTWASQAFMYTFLWKIHRQTDRQTDSLIHKHMLVYKPMNQTTPTQITKNWHKKLEPTHPKTGDQVFFYISLHTYSTHCHMSFNWKIVTFYYTFTTVNTTASHYYHYNFFYKKCNHWFQLHTLTYILAFTTAQMNMYMYISVCVFLVFLFLCGNTNVLLHVYKTTECMNE